MHQCESRQRRRPTDPPGGTLHPSGAIPGLETAALEWDRTLAGDRARIVDDALLATPHLRGGTEHRFRQPKELVLFSKNLLYLKSLATAFAPDINLLAEIGPVFAYFQRKYPAELTQILLGSLARP